jgi:cytochrome c oxidase subunit 3
VLETEDQFAHTALEDDGPVSHQFDTLAQQQESGTLAMWAFLATEVLFFGGLIAAYAIYRHQYFEAWYNSSKVLDNFKLLWVNSGAWNTAVLLTSSLTVALSVHYAKLGDNKQVIKFLAITMVLGTAFLVIKGFEYYHEYVEQVMPSPGWYNPKPETVVGGDEAKIPANPDTDLAFIRLKREMRGRSGVVYIPAD